MVGGSFVVVIGGFAGEDWLLNDLHELHLTSVVDDDEADPGMLDNAPMLAELPGAGAGAFAPAVAAEPGAATEQMPAAAAVAVMVADARSWAYAALGARRPQQQTPPS